MLELSKRVDEAHKKRNTDNEKKNNMPKMLFEIIKMKVNPDQYIRKVVRTNTPILEYKNQRIIFQIFQKWMRKFREMD